MPVKIRIQNKITTLPKINFSFFTNLDKKNESFFNGIEKKIISYKNLREEEKQKTILQKLEKVKIFTIGHLSKIV